MQNTSLKLRHTTSWLAVALGALLAVSLPAGYFGLIYQHHTAAMQTAAHINALLVTRLINHNPDLWRFEEHRLKEQIEYDVTQEDLPEQRRVFDNHNRLIAQTAATIAWPALTRSAELFDSGTVVGRMEVSRSLRPMLINTAGVALLGVLLGIGVFVTLRIFPLRALRQAVDLQLQEKERAQVTLQSIGDAVITTDAEGTIEYLNPVAERLTGWSTAEANGLPLQQVLKLVNEQSGEAVDNPVATVLREDRIVPLANHTALVRRDGERVPIEDSAAPIRNPAGEVLGVVMVFHDLSKQRALTTLLTQQAMHDTLTGLINRGEFKRQLEQALASAHLQGRQHVMCYLDLDQFKIVNDTCGHVAGDELLRQIAGVLRSELRDSDVLARLGGDEFGLLLEGCGLEQAQRVANGLIEAVKKYRFAWRDKSFSISVSIGLVAVTAQSQSVAQILSAADASCYAAKDKGRNRLQVYHPNDSELSQRRGEMDWAARIGEALDEERFVLYFQTVLPLTDGDEEGDHYEVLVRMMDERDEMVPPGVFIPAAERYNLMSAIDRWVIKNVFAGLRKKYFDGGGTPLHTCAINLSGASLGDESFLNFVHEQVALHNIPARCIVLEITETAAITNLSHAVGFIKNLKLAGFRFSLDDFGSGLSSFAYLKNLPVDYLKIDGGFVKDMVNDPIDSAMVQAINQIGHVMGIKTIAEFVESQEILDKLVEIGVDYAQGYGIARPRPLFGND